MPVCTAGDIENRDHFSVPGVVFMQIFNGQRNQVSDMHFQCMFADCEVQKVMFTLLYAKD